MKRFQKFSRSKFFFLVVQVILNKLFEQRNFEFFQVVLRRELDGKNFNFPIGDNQPAQLFKLILRPHQFVFF